VTTAGPDAALELAVEVFPQGFCIPPKARHVFEFLLALLTDAGRKLSGRCLEIPIQPHCYGGFPNDVVGAVTNVDASPAGRWPANVIHDGSAEVVALFPDFLHGPGNQKPTPRGSNKNGVTNFWNTERKTLVTRHEVGMGGSPARFFYCAKASKADRDDGCDALTLRTAAECVDRVAGSAGLKSPRAGAGRVSGARNNHPTVKPTDLMRYLCRLVTPPGGVVLDPFMGSGSTGRGALLEGFRFVGIEREAEYFAIAQARIAVVQGQGDLFAAPGPSP